MTNTNNNNKGFWTRYPPNLSTISLVTPKQCHNSRKLPNIITPNFQPNGITNPSNGLWTNQYRINKPIRFVGRWSTPGTKPLNLHTEIRNPKKVSKQLKVEQQQANHNHHPTERAMFECNRSIQNKSIGVQHKHATITIYQQSNQRNPKRLQTIIRHLIYEPTSKEIV